MRFLLAAMILWSGGLGSALEARHVSGRVALAHRAHACCRGAAVCECRAGAHGSRDGCALRAAGCGERVGTLVAFVFAPHVPARRVALVRAPLVGPARLERRAVPHGRAPTPPLQPPRAFA